MALIDRSVLIKELHKIPGYRDEECELLIPVRDIRRIVDLVPTVDDVEPVIDGIWIYYTNDEGKARWRCNRCGKLCKRDPHDKARCSSCGAHMKKEA